MNFNKQKLNNFLENQDNHQDIKDFVIKVLKLALMKDDIDDDLVYSIFIDLGFIDYTIDELHEFSSDNIVINFYELITMDKELRYIIMKSIYKTIKTGNETYFFERFLPEIGVVVSIDDWLKTNRKNKIKQLSFLE